MGDDRFNQSAVYSGGDNLIIRNTTFYDNDNPYTAALSVTAKNSLLENNTFMENDATYESVYINNGTSTLINNTFNEDDYFCVKHGLFLEFRD
jgi:hypothetical protein